ncbi:MAG: hypothetical protein U5K75_08640 [Ahrensia sp.]|nr:hypothetical protein [Ahrensia sp.]
MSNGSAEKMLDRSANQAGFSKELLIRAICHDVFPETTRRLCTGDKYRNMVSVFSPRTTERAKNALYGKLKPSEFDLFNWLRLLKTDIGLKVEFLQIVAKSLGDDWNDDSRSFLDVTIAMSRLQILLRKLCQLELATADHRNLGSAIIVVPPGESHQFGQCIVEELFSTRGWAAGIGCFRIIMSN